MAGERRTQSLGWLLERTTPPTPPDGAERPWRVERTTGTPATLATLLGPPPMELRLNTWLEPVRVRLTDTGVLLLDEALGAVWGLCDTLGVLVIVMALLPTLMGSWLDLASSLRTS